MAADQTKIIDGALDCFERMKGERATTDSLRQELADYINPSREFTERRSPGQKRDLKIFDSTAPVSNVELASGLHGMMTSPATRWIEIMLASGEEPRDDDGKNWLREVSDGIWRRLNAPSSMF